MDLVTGGSINWASQHIVTSVSVCKPTRSELFHMYIKGVPEIHRRTSGVNEAETSKFLTNKPSCPLMSRLGTGVNQIIAFLI